MNFFRHKAAILAAILCLGLVAGILWFCLAGPAVRRNPDGVLVQEAWPGSGAAVQVKTEAVRPDAVTLEVTA